MELDSVNRDNNNNVKIMKNNILFFPGEQEEDMGGKQLFTVGVRAFPVFPRF